MCPGKLFNTDTTLPHAIHHCESQTLASDLETVLDVKLLEAAGSALERGEAVDLTLPIRNTNRTVGTILGSEVSRRHGADGLPDDTITLRFQGSAGQSFAAFCTRSFISEWE